MFNNINKYYFIFFMGIFLQSTIVIGICISSLNKFNELLYDILFKLLIIPNLLSYALVGIGLIGIFDITGKLFNKK